jgi:hypothetical protein
MHTAASHPCHGKWVRDAMAVRRLQARCDITASQSHITASHGKSKRHHGKSKRHDDKPGEMSEISQ